MLVPVPIIIISAVVASPVGAAEGLCCSDDGSVSEDKKHSFDTIHKCPGAIVHVEVFVAKFEGWLYLASRQRCVVSGN